MKKHKLLLLALLPFFTFVISCRKETMTEESIAFSKSKGGKKLTSISEKQVIKDWLVGHDVKLNKKDKNTLEIVRNNLNYDDINIEKRKNGEDIIIIPIKEGVKEHLNLNAKYLKLDANSVLNYIIVRSTEGKLRFSYIVSFQPLDGKKQSKLTNGTLENIFNNKPVADEGMFKFINPDGKLSYQLEYKKGKISAWGELTNRSEAQTKKDIEAARQAIKKNNGKSVKVLPVDDPDVECLDYYLVITFINDDGSYDQIWSFLYTECSNDDGGGGGDPYPEEEPDMEVITTESSTQSVGNVLDEDISSDPDSFAPTHTSMIVVVRHKAEVYRRYNRIRSVINHIEIAQPEIIDGQVSPLYFNTFLQNYVIRKANLLAVTFWSTYLGPAAVISWHYDLHFTYFVSPHVNQVSTRQVECLHEQFVAPTVIGTITSY